MEDAVTKREGDDIVIVISVLELLLQVEQEFNVPCYSPANGEMITVASGRKLPVTISRSLIDSATVHGTQAKRARGSADLDAVMIVDNKTNALEILEPAQALQTIGDSYPGSSFLAV